MEHGYVALPSRSVGAVLGDLDVSTDAEWSIGHSAIHSLVTWSEESFSSMIDSVMVRHYVPTSSDSLRRCYAVQVGAQRLSRKFRLAMFGSTHVEVDICGSFYEIVRRFQFDEDTSRSVLPHIHELRSMLTDFFAPYAIATQHQLSKKLPLRIMNSTPYRV